MAGIRVKDRIPFEPEQFTQLVDNLLLGRELTAWRWVRAEDGQHQLVLGFGDVGLLAEPGPGPQELRVTVLTQLDLSDPPPPDGP